MGNCFGLYDLYKHRKKDALESLKHHKEEDGVFVEEDKVNEVIDIDDDDDKGMQDVSDDSGMEEVDIMEWKDGRRNVENLQGCSSRTAEKEIRSLDFSVFSDVSNVDGKVCAEKNMDLMLLDHKKYDLGMPVYKQLHQSANKRDGKISNIMFDIEVNEKRWQEYHFSQSWTKGKQVKKDWVEECFTPLTEEEESEVAKALSNCNMSKVMVSHVHSNIDITGEKLQCLKPTSCLNDEVINVYLELLKEREKREPEKFLKCHFFNTFFYKKLIGRGGYNFQSVQRWTTQRKLGYSLLECDKIFVPIHQQFHWCLAIINKKEEKIQYLDSFKGVDSQVLDVLAKYYVDEVKEKSGKEIDVSSWELKYVRHLPEQKNGFDCGMFMIKYADFSSRNLGLCFGQEHMPYFRKRTAKELLRLRAD